MYILQTNYDYMELNTSQTISKKNEVSVILNKTTKSICAIAKIQIAEWKLKFWKTWFCHHKLGSSPIFKVFPGKISDDINEYEFFLFYF